MIILYRWGGNGTRKRPKVASNGSSVTTKDVCAFGGFLLAGDAFQFHPVVLKITLDLFEEFRRLRLIILVE